MAWDYFRDGFNPRGAEYGATARAADAAQRNAETAEDLLELQLASSDQQRAKIAARISTRREREARRRAWWQRLDLIASALFVGGIAWYVLTPASNAPASAVPHDVPAHVSKVPDDANAPVRQAQAPDDSDRAAVEQRGLDLIGAAGTDTADEDKAHRAQNEASYTAVNAMFGSGKDIMTSRQFNKVIDHIPVIYKLGDLTPAEVQRIKNECIASSLQVEMGRDEVPSTYPIDRAAFDNAEAGCEKLLEVVIAKL